ncbi:MAG TPA: sigma-70 family RNA polymerase sigma factor, partial [Verrucomicrobiae bacterium]
MNLTDSLKLLRDYADRGDEGAFRQLVEQYIDLVYSAAIRRVGGDASLAQDVTQAVFTDLARKASSLKVEMLGGWLHRHTGFVASNMVRSEQRRQVREQEAAQMNAISDSPDSLWQQLAPVLDDTIESLDPSDRQAVLLRFFERHDFRHIGNALGISDDAAQKRVSRALEKLRALLTERGVTLSVILLSSLLAGRVVMAAPAGMAGSVARIALSGAAGGSLGVALLKFTKAHAFKIVLAAVVAATAIWPFKTHPSASTHEITPPANSVASTITSTNAPTGNISSTTTSASPSTDTNTTRKILVLNIVAADSGKPVPDVELDYNVSGKEEGARKSLHATRLGVCKVPVPEGTTELSLISQRDGFANTLLDWRPDRREHIPAQYTLKLARAVPIGGQVLGPDGNPVAGAQVGFNNMPDPGRQTHPQSDNFSLPVYWITATTDAQGHWQIDRIGKDALKSIYGSASHSLFVGTPLIFPGQNPEASTQLVAETFVFKLGHAVTVRGIVKDAGGQPVPNVDVLVGRLDMGGSRQGKGQDDGTFSVPGCHPGRTCLTASADGYAATTLDVSLTDNSGPFEIVLHPGKLLKLRVVDEGGNPVTNATVWLDTMQNGQMNVLEKKPTSPQVEFDQKVDPEGRLEWDSAPDTELTFDASANGYMDSRGLKIRPDGLEHVITLGSALTISGTVNDATTGQPIPKFRIIAGWPEYDPADNVTNLSWSTIDRFWQNFADGKFQYTFNEPVLGEQEKPVYVFKIEADGYAPFITRSVQASEHSIHFDVALTPAAPATITVLSPDNEPVAGADIAIVSPGARISLVPGGISHENEQSGGTLLTTDDHGQFTFLSDPTVTKIIAASSQGYVEATPAQLADNAVMQMMAWGRVEGTYMTNGQPVVGRSLCIEYSSEVTLDTVSCDSMVFRTTTDSQGRFTFDKVPPGNRQV